MEKTVRVLLVVGNGNNIFVRKYAEWIKKKLKCTIDVFQIDANGYSDSTGYDTLDCSASFPPTLFNRRFFRRFLDLYKYYSLYKFLNGKRYDIIHCHWLIGHTVFSYNLLRKHCSLLFGTFWGGEFTQQVVLGSFKKYNFYLRQFLNSANAVINSKYFMAEFKTKFPEFNGHYYIGNLGASGLDHLKSLLMNNSKNICKEYFNIPPHKLCVQIGYSGKSLHQHLPIIKELERYPDLCNKIHILNPMTRDCSENYSKEVIKTIEEAGFSHTTLIGQPLTDEEISMLRCATDIVLQLSEFDGFSRSILEGFCAKNLVIYGDWLHYDDALDQNKLKGIPVKSIAEGVEELCNAIHNMKVFETMCDTNSKNGFENNMWEYCINDWVNAYIKEIELLRI